MFSFAVNIFKFEWGIGDKHTKLETLAPLLVRAEKEVNHTVLTTKCQICFVYYSFDAFFCFVSLKDGIQLKKRNIRGSNKQFLLLYCIG